MCFLWFLKCFVPFGPFVHIHIAIGYVVILFCKVLNSWCIKAVLFSENLIQIG
jgi:hypothetical protein